LRLSGAGGGNITDMEPRRRSIDRHVRADAESIFVPVDELADAQIDDLVDLRSPDDGTSHAGRITERVDDSTRGEFFIVRLDDAPEADPDS